MIVMMCGALAAGFGDAVAVVDARLVTPSRLIIEATTPTPRCRSTCRLLRRIIVAP
jgi:hypothetical protein